MACDLNKRKREAVKDALVAFKGTATSIKINEENNTAIIRWGPEYKVKTKQAALNMVYANLERVKRWSQQEFNRGYNDWVTIDGSNNDRIVVKGRFPKELEKAFVVRAAEEGDQESIDKIHNDPYTYGVPGSRPRGSDPLEEEPPIMFQTTNEKLKVLESLNNIIYKFLKDSGLGKEIELKTLDEYKQKYKVRYGKELDPIAFADISNNLIAFSQDKIDGTSLLEEAMHFVTYYMWETPAIQDIVSTIIPGTGIRWIENSDEYLAYHAHYVDIYRDQLKHPKWDILALQEVTTKVLTNFIYNYERGVIQSDETKKPFYRAIAKFVRWFKNLFGRKVNRKYALDYPSEVRNALGEVGTKFLNSTLKLTDGAASVPIETFVKTDLAEVTGLQQILRDTQSNLKYYKTRLGQNARQLFSKAMKKDMKHLANKYQLSDILDVRARVYALYDKLDEDLLTDSELLELRDLTRLEGLMDRDADDVKTREKLGDITSALNNLSIQLKNGLYQQAINSFILGTEYIDEGGNRIKKRSILQDAMDLNTSIIKATEDYNDPEAKKIQAFPIAIKAIEFEKTFGPIIDAIFVLSQSKADTTTPFFDKLTAEERINLKQGIENTANFFNQLRLNTNNLWGSVIEAEIAELINTNTSGREIFENIDYKREANEVQWDVSSIARLFAGYTDMSPRQIQGAIKKYFEIHNKVVTDTKQATLSMLELMDKHDDKLKDNPVVKRLMKEAGFSQPAQLIQEVQNGKMTGYILNGVNVGKWKKAQKAANERILTEVEKFVFDNYGARYDIPRGEDRISAGERNRLIYTYSNSLLTQQEKDDKINPIKNLYKSLWGEWYEEHTEPRDDMDEVVAQRLEELTSVDYEIWENENFYVYEDSLGNYIRKPIGELVAPKKSYTNSHFAELSAIPEFMELYDQYFDMKEESDDSLPVYVTSSYEFRFRLPQISIDTFDALYHSGILKGKGALSSRVRELWKKLKFATLDKFRRTSDDAIFKNRPREEYIVDENLPSLSTPPIRYVTPLENPEMLSNDVVGNLMLYMGMAHNYREVSDNMPYFSALMESAKRSDFYKVGWSGLRNKKGKTKLATGTSTTVQVMKDLFDVKLYGKGKPDVNIKFPGSDKEFSVTKMSEFLAAWKRDINLKGNYPAIVVGYISANVKEKFLERMSGRNFTSDSANWGRMIYWQNLPNMLSNFETPIKTNKISALGQHLDVTDSSAEQLRDTEKSRFARVVHKQSHYGLWRMADFGLRNRTMLAILDDYRFKNGRWYTHEQWVEEKDSVGKRVNKEEDWVKHKGFLKSEDTIGDPNSMYNKIRFEVPPGKKRAELVFDKEVDEAAVNFIKNKIKSVNAQIATQKSDLDDAYIDHTMMGSWLFMHKSFMRMGVFRRLKNRHRNYVAERYEEGNYNFLREWVFPREANSKVYWKDMWTRRQNLTPEQREGSARFLYDVVWANLAFIIGIMVCRSIDDEDPRAYLQFIQYLAIRNYQEAITFLGPQEFLGMGLRPIPATDFWGALVKIIPGVKDNIYENRPLENSPYTSTRQQVLIKTMGVMGIRGAYETSPINFNNSPLDKWIESEKALSQKAGFIEGKYFEELPIPNFLVPLDWVMDMEKDAKK